MTRFYSTHGPRGCAWMSYRFLTCQDLEHVQVRLVFGEPRSAQRRHFAAVSVSSVAALCGVFRQLGQAQEDEVHSSSCGGLSQVCQNHPKPGTSGTFPAGWFPFGFLKLNRFKEFCSLTHSQISSSAGFNLHSGVRLPCAGRQ